MLVLASTHTILQSIFWLADETPICTLLTTSIFLRTWHTFSILLRMLTITLTSTIFEHEVAVNVTRQASLLVARQATRIDLATLHTDISIVEVAGWAHTLSIGYVPKCSLFALDTVVWSILASLTLWITDDTDAVWIFAPADRTLTPPIYQYFALIATLTALRQEVVTGLTVLMAPVAVVVRAISILLKVVKWLAFHDTEIFVRVSEGWVQTECQRHKEVGNADIAEACHRSEGDEVKIQTLILLQV